MNEEERSEHMVVVLTIANEQLPKLIELLRDIQPEYRQRAIDAAMILLGHAPDGGPVGGS